MTAGAVTSALSKLLPLCRCKCLTHPAGLTIYAGIETDLLLSATGTVEVVVPCGHEMATRSSLLSTENTGKRDKCCCKEVLITITRLSKLTYG